MFRWPIRSVEVLGEPLELNLGYEVLRTMEWSAEHTRPEATIHSLSDALWWAVSTITTVGYGDKYPVTPEGKAVALTLMLVGIAIFGLVTATLASLFVERDAEQEADSIRADIARLEDKLDRVLRSLDPAAIDDNNGEANDQPLTTPIKQESALPRGEEPSRGLMPCRRSRRRSPRWRRSGLRPAGCTSAGGSFPRAPRTAGCSTGGRRSTPPRGP